MAKAAKTPVARSNPKAPKPPAGKAGTALGPFGFPAASPAGRAMALAAAQRIATPGELEKAAGLSKGTLGHAKKRGGNLSPDILARLADRLQTTRAVLLGDTPAAGEVSSTPAAGASAGDGLLQLRHDQVKPDPDNPRKIFDRDKLEDFATGIGEIGGIHTPIVVRRPAKGAGYIIIAGERRWRAAAILAKRGKPITIPAVLRDVDAFGALKIAMSENVERESMHPLEEGAGFRRMRDEFGTETRAIAEQFGKTPRWVQLRIALDEKLSDKAKKKFLQGEMKMAAAEALCRAPKESQDAILKGIGFDTTERQIEMELRRGSMAVGTAIFRREDYKGAMIEDAEGRPVAYADGRQAGALQKKAYAEKLKKLEAEWSFVKVMDYAWHDPSAHGYARLKDKTKAGCLVHISDHNLQVTIFTGWAPAAKARAAAGTAAGKADGKPEAAPPREAFTKTHLEWAQGIRTLALQTGLLETGAQTAMAFAVLSLMTRGSRSNYLCLRVSHIQTAGSRPVNTALRHRLDQMMVKPGATMGLAAKIGDQWEVRPGQERAFFAWLIDNPEMTQALFTILVAQATGDWVNYMPRLGADDLLQAMAQATAARPAEHFRLDAAYLNRFSRDGLERIAAAAFGPDFRDYAPAKKGEFVAWILANAKPDWTPPEIAFEPPAGILTGFGADPALIRAAEARAKAAAKDLKDEIEDFDAALVADDDEDDDAEAA